MCDTQLNAVKKHISVMFMLVVTIDIFLAAIEEIRGWQNEMMCLCLWGSLIQSRVMSSCVSVMAGAKGNL